MCFWTWWTPDKVILQPDQKTENKRGELATASEYRMYIHYAFSA